MRFDQMTIRLQEAFSSSQGLCSSAQQQALECEHLLLALFQDFDGRFSISQKGGSRL